MIQIDHTCIKGKSNGIYKTVKSPTLSVVAEEKPEETTTPIYPEVSSVDFKTDTHLDIDSEHLELTFEQELEEDLKRRSCPCCGNFIPYIYEKVCVCGYKKSEHLDFDSIVREVKEDIANDNFLDKCIHYMELLKVDRQEFDDYLTYEFTHQEMEEMIETGDDEPLWEMEVKVNEVKVFDRLFALYCPDTAFVIPPETNHYLREYVDRLEPDGRYFPKKQLSLFGEV